MLNRIPLRCASGIVSNRDCETEGVGQLSLEFGLPGTIATVVTSAGVGKDQYLSGARISDESFPSPPVSDGMNGKSRSVVGNTDHNRTAVGAQIVDAIGNGNANSIGPEVVVIDQ